MVKTSEEEAKTLCPLCKAHSDGEEESFTTCEEILAKVKTQGCFENIFEETISRETIDKMKKILKIREKGNKN